MSAKEHTAITEYVYEEEEEEEDEGAAAAGGRKEREPASQLAGVQLHIHTNTTTEQEEGGMVRRKGEEGSLVRPPSSPAGLPYLVEFFGSHAGAARGSVSMYRAQQTTFLSVVCAWPPLKCQCAGVCAHRSCAAASLTHTLTEPSMCVCVEGWLCVQRRRLLLLLPGKPQDRQSSADREGVRAGVRAPRSELRDLLLQCILQHQAPNRPPPLLHPSLPHSFLSSSESLGRCFTPLLLPPPIVLPIRN